MWPILLLIAYCVLIVLSSLLGGLMPWWMRLTHTRLQLMMSMVAGLMLGVAVLHLLPHAVMESGSLDDSVGWMLGGMLTMFFLIRVFHVHQHGQPAPNDRHVCGGHEHGHDHSPSHAAPGKHRLAWVGLALGLSLHTLIDGVALSAAVAADARHAPDAALAGLATFLAVVLHKPLDSLAIAMVMIAGNRSWRLTMLVNGAYALMCPVGAGMFYFLANEQFAHLDHAVIGAALAFAAGVFLCIALADILPEVTFHSHDRIALSAALLAGVVLAYGIGFLEGDHAHNHASHERHSHDHHHGHSHSHHGHRH